MINFYQETINILNEYGKTEADIRWIGLYSRDYQKDNVVFDLTGISLKDIFDFEYDNGWGTEEINLELKIVGDDWWLERHEYDGSEWWEYKTLPDKPEKVAETIDFLTSHY